MLNKESKIGKFLQIIRHKPLGLTLFFVIVFIIFIFLDSRIENAISNDKFFEHNSRREALAADTDTFQDTITSKLMEDQIPLHITRLFNFIRNNTSDKMRIC